MSSVISDDLSGTGPGLRSVSSVAFAITGENAFDQAIAIACSWMRSLNPAIPSAASDIKIFDVGGGGDHPARAVLLETPESRIWSASIDKPDDDILGRTWITEITIAQRGNETHFGTRLLNITRKNNIPFTASIPRVVRDIIKNLSCYADDLPLSDNPMYVNEIDKFNTLIELLENPNRKLPIIIMAEAITRHPRTNLFGLARRLCGAAHVVGLTGDLSWSLTFKAGRQLSVFDGAVRLYRPGFRLSEIDPYAHPLWLPAPDGTSAPSDDPIIARVLALGVSKGTTDYPRFEAVKQAASEKSLIERRRNASDAEMIELYGADNALLRQQLEDLRREQNQWLSDTDIEISANESLIAQLKADNFSYSLRIKELISTVRRPDPSDKRAPLDDLERFGTWVENNISDRIWFAPKAIKEIQNNGIYRNPWEIGEAIYLMDELYIPMKQEKDPELYSLFVKKMEELNISISNCFATENDIYRYPEYSTYYNAEKHWCNEHIKRGGGTDPRSMFRIYFKWLDEEKILIVGHLPTHLTNNLTD